MEIGDLSVFVIGPEPASAADRPQSIWSLAEARGDARAQLAARPRAVVASRGPRRRGVARRRDHVANIAQQKKRNRLAVKQRLRNRHAKSTIKTLFKQLDATVTEQQADEATSLARLLTRRIDQAAAKGVIHKNSAARKKSQVAHILARLSG